MSIDTQELRRLHAAATPGPWHFTTCETECYEQGADTCPRKLEDMDDACRKCENCRFISGAMIPETKTVEWGDYEDMSDEDAALIVAAVNALPQLLDTIDTQAATLAERDAEIGRLRARNSELEALFQPSDDGEPYPHIEQFINLAAYNRSQADNARLTAELAAMTERAKAAEGWLTRFIKMMCLAAKDKDKVLRRMHIGAGDYMGSGYALLDAFNDIWDDFTEKADDELFKNVRRELDSECGPQAQAVEGAGHE